MSSLFSISPNLPQGNKPEVVSPADLDDIWIKIQQQFPNGIAGLTPAQILQKVGAVLPLTARAALVGALIKDWVQIIADITTTAENISNLLQQNEACICEQLTCLVKAINESSLPRQAQWNVAKGFQFLLQRLGDDVRLAAIANRQGFVLDDFGLGLNNLNQSSTSLPFGTIEDFRDPIAEPCQEIPVPFLDPL